MPEPKLVTVMKQFAERLNAIGSADGFYTDIGNKVERYPRLFNEEECPACAVYLASADKLEKISESVGAEPVAVIYASSIYKYVAEDKALEMLADIHAAIELKNIKLKQQTTLDRSLKELSWQIVYPENSGRTVSIEVLYQFNYTRKFGEN